MFPIPYILALSSLVSHTAFASNATDTAPRNFDPRIPNPVTVYPKVITPGSTVTVAYANSEIRGRTVFVHFGFNGWNLKTSGPGAGLSVDQDNANFFVHKQMHYDYTYRRFVVDIQVPVGARALNMAFCWNTCGAGQWDNNRQNDYGWPIVFPFIGPTLTWNEKTNPSSGVAISFETGFFATAWVEYWAPGKAKKRLTGPTGVIHRFQLTGLDPNTSYSYRVGSGSEFLSAEYSFKTAKEFTGLKKLSFLVFGDAQDNGEDGVFADLIQEIVTNQKDFDFVISTGDLPWNDRPGDWWTFFDKGRELFARHVVMPVVGNHDTPTVDSNRDNSSFVRYFALPNVSLDRAYYQFKFAHADFFAMNSERPDDFHVNPQLSCDSDNRSALTPSDFSLRAGNRKTPSNGVQYCWLQKQLLARQSLRVPHAERNWTFAYWHIPPFNAGNRHAAQQSITRTVAGLFDSTIDWHFGGHEHLYQRTKPLRDANGNPRIESAYGLRSDEGVGYIVVPSSGVPASSELLPARVNGGELRERLAYPSVPNNVNSVPSVIGYARVDIEGDDIDIQIFQRTPQSERATVVDRVQYRRD
jgi:hypothetical protein